MATEQLPGAERNVNDHNGSRSVEAELREAAQAAERALGESDAGDQYTNPRADKLAAARAELATHRLKINRVELGLLGPMYMAMSDVYSLSEPGLAITASDYVSGELRKIRPEPISGQPPKSEKAAYAVKGINQLINAFSRARTSPITGERDSWALEDFINERNNRSRLWDDPEQKEAILSAVDSCFNVLKIMCSREALIHAAGDDSSIRETDKEDLKIVSQWLKNLRSEFQIQGKIQRTSALKAAITSAVASSTPPRTK